MLDGRAEKTSLLSKNPLSCLPLARPTVKGVFVPAGTDVGRGGSKSPQDANCQQLPLLRGHPGRLGVNPEYAEHGSSKRWEAYQLKID